MWAKENRTRVHDISVSIKCLIGIYISSFDPTRSRYGSSARFLVQAPRPSFHQVHLGLNVSLNVEPGNRLTRETAKERIGKGEFTRFSFGRLDLLREKWNLFPQKWSSVLDGEKSVFIFRVHLNDQSAKMKYEKRFVVNDSVEFCIYRSHVSRHC